MVRSITRWFSKYSLQLALILFLAAVTRWFKLSQLLHWTLDEEFWSYLPYNMAQGINIPLIGGHIGGTGVYSGPLFVWSMSPVFLISSHPLWVGFFVSSVGILSVFLIARLLRPLTSKYAALLISLFYTVSTFATIYDRKYWNASIASISSIITLWLVYQIKQKPTKLKLFSLAFIISLAFHAHMTGLVLVIFSFLALFVLQLPKKNILWLFGFFLLFQTPLVLFDLRHDFFNTKALLTLLTESSETVIQPSLISVGELTVNTFSRVIFMPTRDISRELTLCSQMAHTRSIPQIGYQILAGIILIFGGLQLRKKNLFSLLLYTNIFLVIAYHFLSPENFYSGQLSEYYYLPALISFLALAVQLLIRLHKAFPLGAYTLGIFLIVVNLHITFNLSHSQSWASRNRQLESMLAALDGEPFSLEVVGHPCQIYGYRYFLSQNKTNPSESYVDANFGWLYDPALTLEPATKHVVIDVDKDWGPDTISIQEITKNKVQ